MSAASCHIASHQHDPCRIQFKCLALLHERFNKMIPRSDGKQQDIKGLRHSLTQTRAACTKQGLISVSGINCRVTMQVKQLGPAHVTLAMHTMPSHTSCLVSNPSESPPKLSVLFTCQQCHLSSS